MFGAEKVERDAPIDPTTSPVPTSEPQVRVARNAADPHVRDAIDDELREFETLWDDLQTPTLKERDGSAAFLDRGAAGEAHRQPSSE